MVSITTKPGTSLYTTTKVLSQIEKEIQRMPQVEHYATVSGYSFSGSGASAGMIILSLRDWSERSGEGGDVWSVIDRINALSAKIPDAQIFAAAPPMITGYGMVNGFELHVQDKAGKPVTELDEATRGFITALSERLIRLSHRTILNTHSTSMPPGVNGRAFRHRTCWLPCLVIMADNMSPTSTVSRSSTA